MKFINLIFDLDGTIIDSAPTILRCIKAAGANYKLNFNELDSKLIGPPIADIISRLDSSLTKEEIIHLTKAFRYCYDNDTYEDTALYDGIYQLLLFLINNNYKLFIATNKPMLPTKNNLQHLEIDFFEDIVCIDSVKSKKLSKTEMIQLILCDNQLRHNETVMIGDSIGDMESAKNNKINSIAVSWGYEPDQKALSDIADYYVQNVDELKRIFYSKMTLNRVPSS